MAQVTPLSHMGLWLLQAPHLGREALTLPETVSLSSSQESSNLILMWNPSPASREEEGVLGKGLPW